MRTIFYGIKVAQLHWKLNTAGDDIDRTGVDFHVPYSADLTTLFAHHVAHRPLKRRRGRPSCDSSDAAVDLIGNTLWRESVTVS